MPDVTPRNGLGRALFNHLLVLGESTIGLSALCCPMVPMVPGVLRT